MFGLQILLSVALPLAAGEPSEGPAVSVTALNGEVIAATLLELDAESALISRDGQTRTIPLRELAAVQFVHPTTNDANPEESSNPTPFEVYTTDGGRFRCRRFESDGRSADLWLTDGRGVQLPIGAVALVVLSAIEPPAKGGWEELARAPRGRDQLLIERQGSRSTVDGIVESVGDKSLRFALDGEQLEVQRDRVAAICYSHPPAEPGAGFAAIVDGLGNRWLAQPVGLRDGELTVRTGYGRTFPLPVSTLTRIDFARTRQRYLSDMEPDVATYVPFFDTGAAYRRDGAPGNRPLLIGEQRFDRGLWVRSKSVLEYSLEPTDRRFEGVVGIHADAGALGDAVVRILVDGREQLAVRVVAGEPPQAIHVDLNAPRTLTLEVDYGELYDLGDQVVIGDAKVIRE